MVEKTRITAAEFFELPESVLPIQLIEGEVIQMPTLIPDHQDAVGGRVFMATLDVYLDDEAVRSIFG